jgi:hypothetical protein
VQEGTILPGVKLSDLMYDLGGESSGQEDHATTVNNALVGRL